MAAVLLGAHAHLRGVALPNRERRNERRRVWPVRAYRGFSFESKEKSGDKGRFVVSLPICHHLNRISTLADVLMPKPQKIEFGGMQATGGLILSTAVLSMMPTQRVAGILILALCVTTTLTGYARCLYLSRDKGKALDVVLHAHEAAKDVYSSSIPSGGQITWHRFVLSPFYEPSPIYMLLNCWGLYAVGQLTLCAVVGGRKFLCLCGAAFALGRLLQFFITQSTAVQLTHVTQRKTQADSEVRDRLIELFFLPNGTWGFGPILNALIWFSCFAFPYLLYPATPSGITAPIWTAIGIPTLLLLEDLYSIIHASRRAQKIKTGSTPGLQLAALLVGIGGACLFR